MKDTTIHTQLARALLMRLCRNSCFWLKIIKLGNSRIILDQFGWNCGKLLVAYLASSFFLLAVWSVAESFCLELLKFFCAFCFRLPGFGFRIAPLTTRLLLRRLLLGILPPFPRPIFSGFWLHFSIVQNASRRLFLFVMGPCVKQIRREGDVIGRHRFEIQVLCLWREVIESVIGSTKRFGHEEVFRFGLFSRFTWKSANICEF